MLESTGDMVGEVGSEWTEVKCQDADIDAEAEQSQGRKLSKPRSSEESKVTKLLQKMGKWLEQFSGRLCPFAISN